MHSRARNATFSRELVLQELKYCIFQGSLCIQEPQMLQGICASKNSQYYIFQEFVPSSACRAHRSFRNSADHRLHSCQSRWLKFWDPGISLSGIMFIRNCGKVQTLVAFCANAWSHTHTDTHTERKEGKNR